MNKNINKMKNKEPEKVVAMNNTIAIWILNNQSEFEGMSPDKIEKLGKWLEDNEPVTLEEFTEKLKAVKNKAELEISVILTTPFRIKLTSDSGVN